MKALALPLLAAALVVASNPGLAQDIYGDPLVPLAGRALGTAIHTRDAEELRYVVLKRLTDRYADEKRITVTQAEKDAYNERMRASMAQDREQNTARRDELRQKLASGGLSDAERGSMSAELEGIDKFLAALAEPPGEPEEIKAARDQVANAFIGQWKINRALYRQYGGRIIFQQGGPEPLDAYRKFLEERQARGDFAILNKALETEFWRYYRTDAIHSFYRRGSKEEAQAFDVPWWLSK